MGYSSWYYINKEAGGIVDNFELKKFNKISIKASNERISGDLNKKINIF